MLQLKSKHLRAVFSHIGARLLLLEVDGVDVIFGNAFSFDPFRDDAMAGATCGRHAGRISRAAFELDDQTYPLAQNCSGFQIHGGPVNFGNSKWTARERGGELIFGHKSPNGDQGFPGEVTAEARFGLTDDSLYCELTAVTTAPTVINLTNHSHWNIQGQTARKGSALDLELQIFASSFLPSDANFLPTGEIAPVAGTQFDFRELRAVREPYDVCFCLDGKRGELKRASIMRDLLSGRRMEILTTECALQFFTSNNWDGTIAGKNGRLLRHQAIAIEPQNYPDAPNHPNFPSSFLRQGEQYRNRIEWHFS